MILHLSLSEAIGLNLTKTTTITTLSVDLIKANKKKNEKWISTETLLDSKNAYILSCPFFNFFCWVTCVQVYT